MTKNKVVISNIFKRLFNLFGKEKKDNNISEFKFTEAKNNVVFTCNHVTDEQSPILYATHDLDGYWQFLCGKRGHTEENSKIISLKQAVELDHTLNDLFDLPIGNGAIRKKINRKWKPYKF